MCKLQNGPIFKQRVMPRVYTVEWYASLILGGVLMTLRKRRDFGFPESE